MAPGRLGDAADVVRLYLRESRRVPLLTRGDEAKIARRIERGELDTLIALSRSALAIEEMCRLPGELAARRRSIQEVVLPGGDGWTNEGAAKRKCELVAVVGEIERLNRQSIRLQAKNGAKQARGPARNWVIARQQVRISQLIRSIRLTPLSACG